MKTTVFGKLADGRDVHQYTLANSAHINDQNEQLAFGRDYNNSWVLKGAHDRVLKAAELNDAASGRMMAILADQPRLQFYSGDFLDGTAKGENGIDYRRRTGLCLEAQAYPDTPNKPQFMPVTLRPGQTYRQTTICQFSIQSHLEENIA